MCGYVRCRASRARLQQRPERCVLWRLLRLLLLFCAVVSLLCGVCLKGLSALSSYHIDQKMTNRNQCAVSITPRTVYLLQTHEGVSSHVCKSSYGDASFFFTPLRYFAIPSLEPAGVTLRKTARVYRRRVSAAVCTYWPTAWFATVLHAPT